MPTHKELTIFLKTAKRPLVAIIGPTASGKTKLSLEIAKKFNGEIISTDSRQIYSEMPISTDLIPEKERQNIPHHLLGIAKPDQEITLAQFRDFALDKIEEIGKRKKLPILTGGTGLYISSIIDSYNLKKIPPDKQLRAKLEKLAALKGNLHVYNQLLKLDPEAAKSIHPNNLRYVMRAIERAQASSHAQASHQIRLKNPPEFNTFLIGINWPRKELYERINHRVELQIERGLIKEVEKLLKKYDPKLPSMSSLGVKELIPFLKGEQALEECIKQLKQNTRNYAKRQMTWFRRYDNVHWLKPKK